MIRVRDVGCRLRAAALTAGVMVFAMAAFPGAAAAQTAPDTSTATPPAAKRPCTAPEFHQFDFWIGTWEVRTPDGKVAGTNRIEPILDGCVLQESWRGARGLRGTSLNTYVPSTKRWQQTWMDQQGTLLLLDGELQGGSMVLQGESPSSQKPGVVTQQRITWTPASDGTVRQLWEASEDKGKSWTTVFDGRYSRLR